MEIEGKIIQINPVQSGEGRNGTWRKQEFIIETKGQYPKKVCIVAWGDKIDQFDLKENEEVKVSIDIESREFNGRWYTDVRAWKVEKAGDNQFDAPPEPDILPPSGDDMPDDEPPF